MRYPIELKNQAIEMAIEGNKSVAQVARDLDIKLNTLYGWVDKYRQNHPSQFPLKNKDAPPLNLEAENKRLKKKLADSQRDVELLKKAAVYFTAHSK